MEEPRGDIQVRVDPPVGTIVIDCPQRSNALSRQMVSTLIERIKDLHVSGQAKAIILTGAGTSFCSGTDLQELNATFSEDNPFEIWHEETQALLELVEALLRFPKPVVGAINGPVAGIGLALMLAADLVVASDDAKLAMPEARRGLSAGLTLPLLSFRLGTSAVTQMLFTGKTMTAADAHASGLFHEVVPADFVWARAFEMAKLTTQGARESHQMAKQLINETVGESLFTQLSIGAANMAAARTTEAAKEGVAAFLEKREPNW